MEKLERRSIIYFVCRTKHAGKTLCHKVCQDWCQDLLRVPHEGSDVETGNTALSYEAGVGGYLIGGIPQQGSMSFITSFTLNILNVNYCHARQCRK